jgi:hypothetical protein
MTFHSQATAAIVRHLILHGTVRPSDVWPSSTAQCKEPRALGSVFASLHRAGRIRPAGFRVCPRKTRHSGVELAWRVA